MDLISRQDAIDAVMDLPNCDNDYSDTYDKAQIVGVLEDVPSANLRTCEYWDSESNYCALCRPSVYMDER